MRIERIGGAHHPAAVLRALSSAADRMGLPPPAALTGEWFGSRAVIAPSVAIRPTDPGRVFDVPVGSGGDRIGGGWLGYLSYPDGAGTRVPHAAGGWTDRVLRQDDAGEWWYESLTDAAVPDWIVDAVDSPACAAPWRITWTPPDRAAHRAGVLACLEAIAAGEVYQACVCTRFVGALAGSPVDVFADLMARAAPARAAFLSGDWGAVASFSPELFLRRVGDVVTSSPIKGTLPLTESPSELRASVKDVAENVMIVDLVRNDLSRVARTGSVTVPELLAVRPAPGVWHLVSTVTARVDVEVPNAALLDATFPPASVTGTPKDRARELLSAWEAHARGVYCGTVGFASPIAGTELNVAIRTVEFDREGGAVLGVGGGITADSEPETEWQECLHKAAPIVGARGSARGTQTTSGLPGISAVSAVTHGPIPEKT